VQERASESVLNSYRRFLSWRRQQPALQKGGIEFIDALPKNPLGKILRKDLRAPAGGI